MLRLYNIIIKPFTSYVLRLTSYVSRFTLKVPCPIKLQSGTTDILGK